MLEEADWAMRDSRSWSKTVKVRASVVVSQVKPQLATPVSIERRFCPLHFLSSSLLMCLGRQQRRVRVFGPPSSMGESRMEFLVPGFNLAEV